MCHICVGHQHLLLEVSLIHKIISPPPITPIPLTPSHVSGLINVRNEVIVVVHLGKLLNLPTTNQQQILIIHHNEEKLGLLFDAVLSFEQLTETIQPYLEAEVPTSIQPYISGVLGRKRIPVLTPDKIILGESSL